MKEHEAMGFHEGWGSLKRWRRACDAPWSRVPPR